MRQGEAARYVNALCSELGQFRDYLAGVPVRTVYFGGGTPSRLTAEQIGKVIGCIRTVYGLSSLEELTVECNPDDITCDYIRSLRAIGVNRISMGVQSFNDSILRFLGRRHTASQALDAVRSCRYVGINNVSIDLMYGLPGQTLDMFHSDLETAINTGVQHISSYCLSYEDGSPLRRMLHDGKITPATDDLCASMYDLMCATLREGGFEHYEISNFCKPGSHSRHNSSYWDSTPYLGVGAAAHSYNGYSRRWNPSDLDAYMNGIEHGQPQNEIENLSETDLYNERLMLRLRTAQGLNLSLLNHQDRLSVLHSADALIKDGLLLLENTTLRIPEQKMFISDSIISSLFK